MLPRRRWACGAAKEDRCECGEEAGTLDHCLTTCQLAEERRSIGCQPEVLKQAKAAVWDPLFSRAVPAKLKLPPKVPYFQLWEVAKEGTDKVAEGDIYIDGSFKGLYWRAARSAWAAVAYDQQGTWKWTLSGTVAEEHSTSYRAELKALLEVLRIALPPLTIHCDNDQVVQGRLRGKEWCTAATTDCADLGREVWRYLDDKEGEVSIVWVKGHTTWMDVLTRRVTLQQHKGNELADAAAKTARARAEAIAPPAACNGHIKRAIAWYRWILEFATDWVFKEREEDGMEAEEDREEREEHRVSVKLRHEVWSLKGKEVCRRCNRPAAAEGSHSKAFRREECKGAATGRALQALTGNGNYIWNEFAATALEMVRKGGRLMQAAEVPMHMIDKERLQELVRDAKGLDNLRTCLGVEGAQALTERDSWQASLSKDGEAPKQGEEEGRQQDTAQPRPDLEAAKGHVLRSVGSPVFCVKCASYANKRHGTGLKAHCGQPRNRSSNATAARLWRLHQGRHPVTGASFG